MTHIVLRQDHTGRGIPQGEHATLVMAQAHAMLGAVNAQPGPLTANVWYVASPQPDGTFKITRR